MKRVLIAGALACAVAPGASAQYTTPSSSTYGSKPAKKADIVVLGGYAWTLAQDVVLNYANAGELDITDNPFWGVAIDFNVARQGGGKTGQLRLLFRREDSDVTFVSYTPSNPTGSLDCAVEYWQIGGLGGVERGNAMPFTSVTLGATRLVAGDVDEWKFSMIFGLGVKVYTEGKFGFMIQGNWPITFTDSWGGVTVGTGGAGVAVGGTGISQLDVGGGVILSF
ncbi:MAG: hypothetical protein L0Z51_03715 [Candidatus Latescibacteria bacterium]|nr:hypothetical protein [Candidatus Latescibacterota bacterium]